MKHKLWILLIVCLTAVLAACSPAGEAEGELEIEDLEANLLLPTDTGAVYMDIINNTDEDDVLVAASVDGCGVTELHEMSMEGDVMRMQPIDGQRIEIPAGETVSLERGGLHVMCLDKSGEYELGQEVPVSLTFENAGELTLTAVVIDVTGNMEMDDMDHGDMEGMDDGEMEEMEEMDDGEMEGMDSDG